MQVISTVSYKNKGKTKTLRFGHPETDEEFQAMYDLRYDVYTSRGYVDSKKFAHDQDEYDKDGGTVHFIAKMNDQVVGTVRLIQTHPLPTEEIYRFEKDEKIGPIPLDRKAELGRLVVLPYQMRKDKSIPRHLIAIFLVYVLLRYATHHDLVSGLSFVKEKLKDKLEKLRAPVFIVPNFEENYPKDGILYPYFTQIDEPVHPIYFEFGEIKEYFDRLLGRAILFKKYDEDSFFLRNEVLVRFLRVIRIL